MILTAVILYFIFAYLLLKSTGEALSSIANDQKENIVIIPEIFHNVLTSFVRRGSVLQLFRLLWLCECDYPEHLHLYFKQRLWQLWRRIRINLCHHHNVRRKPLVYSIYEHLCYLYYLLLIEILGIYVWQICRFFSLVMNAASIAGSSLLIIA